MDPMCFKKFKKEILRNIKAKYIGAGWYRTAFATRNYTELMSYIKDYFEFFLHNDVINPTVIEKYKPMFDKYDIQLEN
jgi:hypothetical protein